MFEFRGWAVLCFHSHDIDKRLQEAGFQKPLQCFFEMNMQDFVNVQHESGFDSLSVSGLFNHRSALIIDIFRKIAGIMPGFYELLYIRNDEDDKDKTDHSNEFVVWKLTRGNSNQEKDPFLSPCIT
ncbi:Imm7 family immunity protein [Leptospira alexanderi]|uniref:Imm7 family immunity protein n=1 Tax=Leptospira alexanderi TaxID=100053 RepID=UPI0009912FEC|nr:Imm7 family immunity protein [Leptospira alexanderi]